MTNEMFLGGLMILTMVAGIVIAMTTTRNRDSNLLDEEDDPRNHLNSRRPMGRR